MNRKLRVAVLGATGVAGQQFLTALSGHPWFEVACLAASERTAGKRYTDAIRDAGGHTRWHASEPLPAPLGELVVTDASQLTATGIDLVFSALDTDAAKRIEPRLAESVPVISTASAYRYEADVPILLPGVNQAHAQLIHTQRARRGWKGFIAPGPNCTTVGLVMTLKPIHDAFGIERVLMTSLQSVSGAGRSPGVAALDILDNVIPYIPSEEEKVQRETQKILGRCSLGPAAPEGDGAAGEQWSLAPLPLPVSCTCTRVAVLEGHTEAVFVATQRPAPVEAVRDVLRSFGAELQQLGLPSAPARLIEVLDDPFRPQPRLDRDAGGGMTTVVGRLRPELALGEHGVKYVLVSHNTKMGAALGAMLTAEMLCKTGFIG